MASQYLRIHDQHTIQPASIDGSITYLFALALPHLITLWSCSSVHESRSTDFTRLIWVPIPLWMPEQRMHMKIPKFHEAHRGSSRIYRQRNKSRHSVQKARIAVGCRQIRQDQDVRGGHNSRLLRLQSAHILLDSIFSRFLMICWF